MKKFMVESTFDRPSNIVDDPNHNGDAEDSSYSVFQMNRRTGKLKLKPNFSFHFYTSSQPCGNAAIKRWSKCKRPKSHPNLMLNAYPIELHHHQRYFVTAKHEGEVAFLLKRNRHGLSQSYEQTCNGQENAQAVSFESHG
jgi:hypothetical protein